MEALSKRLVLAVRTTLPLQSGEYGTQDESQVSRFGSACRRTENTHEVVLQVFLEIVETG